MSTDGTDLSLETSELVQALLASSLSVIRCDVSEDQLVRFAFGWLSESEEETVLDYLVSSSGARLKLIEIQESIRHSEKRTPVVRAFLDHAIRVSVEAFGALELGLGSWRTEVESALVVRHKLEMIAERYRLSAPKLATSRSSVGGYLLDMEGSLIPFLLSPGAEGCFQLSGNLPEGLSAEGAELRLELIDESLGIVELARGAVSGREWTVECDDFGIWDETVLPAVRLRLCRLEFEVQAHAVIAVETCEGSWESIEVLAVPLVDDGKLRVELKLVDEIRQRYDQHAIDLSLDAGPLKIPICSWLVSDVPEDGRLAAVLDSSFKGTLPLASLHLKFRQC